MLQLGTKWLNCELVYTFDGVNAITTASSRAFEVIKQYIGHFPHSRTTNIWFDHEEKIFFSSEQFRQTRAGKENSFCTSKDEFLKSRWGQPFVDNIINKFNVFENQKVVYDDECIYGELDFVNKYKGKSILFLSGGPSTDSIKWENIDCDYIWSCNNFFLNPRIASKNVDLITIAPNIELVNNVELHKYLQNNNTNISFEIERGDYIKDFQQMKQFSDMYKDRCTFYHTRYRSQPGVSLRLLCYAIMLGASDIYFSGIDGFKKEGPNHCFEVNKKNPNWYNTYGPRFQDRQYVIFWEYLLNLREKYNFTLYNLGKGHPYNVSTEISEKVFPLSKEIQEKIRS